jgi:hypothetical protein
VIYKDGLPKLFLTRKEARDWIETQFGYIRKRKDLQSEPFGWKVPIPVRVSVVVESRS